MTDLELYHFGIKGMRWGVRRYQNKDGSLTPAGKKRYADDPDLQKLDSAKAAMLVAKKAYGKASNRYSNVPTNANRKKFEKARDEFNAVNMTYRKTKLNYDTKQEVSRIKDRDIQFKNKSKHRLRLEDQYKKMGMSDEEAQAAANNRIRTEKILAASAAVTVAACAAYVAHKKIKERTDGVIKAGEALQRIEMQDTGGKLHNVFYVAKGEKDMRRYENLLGMQRKNQTGHAYMMKLAAQEDVKVASMDRCRKTFRELYESDSDFKEAVRKHVPGIGGMSKKQQYDQFNRALVGMHDSEASSKFYSKLKSAGYGAIQDINDMKYSGYHAKNPLIVFDNSKSNIMVKSVKELTSPDIDRRGTKEFLKATGETLAEDFIKKAGPASAVALTAGTVVTYRSDPTSQFEDTTRKVG